MRQLNQVNFAGKTRETGEWIYGDLLRLHEGEGDVCYIFPHEPSELQNLKEFKVFSDSVSQYVGFNDYEDNLLHENTIVDHWDYVHPLTDEIEYCGRYIIKWDVNNAGFVMLPIDRNWDDMPGRLISVGWIKQVCHAFDYPELMKNEAVSNEG